MPNKVKSPQLWSIQVEESPFPFESTVSTQLHTTALERLKRFHSARRQRLFIVSRWLMQQALSAYLQHDVSLQSIIETTSQRPEVADLPKDIFFSLAHSAQLITFVIDSAPVGIDTEFIKPRPNSALMAEAFMSDSELADYHSATDLNSFYRYWCRKEAYYKSLSLIQQQDFVFNQFDSLAVTNRPDVRFFELSTESYQLCSFHQRAVSQIECYEIESDMWSQAHANSPDIHVDAHTIILTEL